MSTKKSCSPVTDNPKEDAFYEKVDPRKTMTPEAQRIAIATACGWKIKQVKVSGLADVLLVPPGWPVDAMAYTGDLPDYLNDLNAIAEAENALFSLGQQKHFVKAMWQICGTQKDRWNDLAGLISATAAQRAEAFLKAIGKWVEK